MDRALDFLRQIGFLAHPGDYRPRYIGIDATILRPVADFGSSMALGAGVVDRFLQA